MNKVWSTLDREFIELTGKFDEAYQNGHKVWLEQLRKQSKDSYKKQALYELTRAEYFEGLVQDAQEYCNKAQDKIEELEDQVWKLKQGGVK